MKRIVVTGGAGFVGSHLCAELKLRGAERVVSLDNYLSGSSDNHHDGVEYIEGHSRDIAQLIDFAPDVLYHLGEYARVEQSFDDVDKVLDCNVQGTSAVIDFCYRRNVKLVYAGSSTKFGDGGLGRQQSPYAWTKAANTELVSNFGRWFGLRYAVTYFYNVYGGAEIKQGRYATLIGLFKERYRQGLPLSVVEPGTQQRNFTHIDDIISALVLVGEKGEGDDYGIGSPEAFSILEVAKIFGGPIEMLPPRAGNRMTAEVRTERTRALGWEPKESLADHIRAFTKEFELGNAQNG